MTSTNVPLARPALGPAEVAAVETVFESRWLGLGKSTADFEAAVGAIVGSGEVLAVNTGTTAIELALRAIGIGPNDRVAVPSMTFVATAQAVVAVGAEPVICDISPTSLNAGVSNFAEVADERTRAIIPISYRGLPIDSAVYKWAADRGIRVVEDAAHSFGSRDSDGRPVGASGDVTCFSFDPIKNITCGEGGAIVFPDEQEHAAAARMRILGIDSTAWSRLEQQRPWEYDVPGPGYRFHMPNLNAAIGLVQLSRLEEFRTTKQSVLATYQEAFKDHPALEMPPMPTERCMPFLAVLLVDDRERFMAHMKAQGIATGVQYQPLHSLSFFANCRRGELTNTDAIYERLVSIPLLNDQTQEETERVVEAVLAFA